jgi:hypothetical protein
MEDEKMTNGLRSSLGTVVTVALFLFAICAATSAAQGFKNVEIEIAGPWDYVVDPGHTDRIVVIAPASNNHVMRILSGGNPNASGSAIEPGYYTLDFDQTFDSTKCPPPAPLNGSKPYPLVVDTSTSATTIGNALGAKGQRYAISIPKPCNFESYSDVRAIISTNPITNPTSEGAYTIWMALLYTVPNSTQSVLLNGVPDTSTAPPYVNLPITFATGVVPSTASAISAVMYFDGFVKEDYICDSYSAAYFDLDEQFWKLKNPHYRLYPELDTNENQTHHYLYDQTQCPQKFLANPMGKMSQSSHTLLDSTARVRSYVRESKPKEAQEALEQVRADAAQLWQGQVPQNVADDLKNASETIDRLIKNPESYQKIDASRFLRLTDLAFLLVPGRADCRKAQISINGAVQ